MSGRARLRVPTKTTTIVASEALMDRVSIHVRKNNDNQTEFYTRAIINQLEKEGDFEIRDIVKREQEESLV